MKTFLSLLAIVCVVITQTEMSHASQTPYEGLVANQAAASVYSFSEGGRQTDQLERRVAVSAADDSDSPRYFGWSGHEHQLQPSEYAGISDGTFITDTGQVSFQRRNPRKANSPEKPKIGPDELPYVLDKNANYAIVLGGPSCIYCKKMYPIVKQLRKEGYTVYYIDTEVWPDIKQRLNRLKGDKKVDDIGSGIPWTVVRENNKTIKLFRGYIAIDKIRPWLKKKKDEDEKKKPTVPEPYDFKALRNESSTKRFTEP